jgi:outer membrane protein assembly factor BamB
MDGRVSRRGFLAAGVAAALGGCAGRAGSPPIRNATAGLEPNATPPVPLEDATRSATWTAGVPGQFTLSTPGMDEETLYVGSGTQVTALTRADGNAVWERRLGAMTHSFSPRVTEDVVVAAARDVLNRRRVVDRGNRPSLTGLDADTGEPLWRERVPVSGSPVVDDGTVLVPLSGDETTAVSGRALSTGEEAWRATLSTPPVFSAPVVAGDGYYAVTVGDEDGDSRLVALTTGGTVRWTVTLDGVPHKGPTVDTAGDGTVYVGTDAGYLYAVGADGTVRWQSSLGGGVNTTPVLDGDSVFATTPSRVVALNAETGEGRWSGTVDNVSKTGLGLGGGMVHVGGNEVAAFDTDGTPRWRIELPGVAGTFGSPLYEAGTLYVGGCVKTDGSSRYDHTVYALE